MSHVACDDLHPGNSTTVKLFNVKVDGTLNNDAVVTVTVKDASNSVVSGGNAVPMPNVAAGAYQGILPNTLGIVLKERYTVEVTATIAGAGVGFWPITKVATPRENCAGCGCG